MKALIFTAGILILIGCALYSISSDPKHGVVMPINLGYFIVISSAFISVSLFKTQPRKYSQIRFHIYQNLAKSDMGIDDLLEAVLAAPVGDTNGRANIKVTICSLLEEGSIIISDQKIKLAQQDGPHRQLAAPQSDF